MSDANKFWLELEKPRDEAHAKQVCSQANNLLKRINPEGKNTFEWSPVKGMYMYGGMDDGGSFTYLDDRGKWLNLEFHGRPLDQTPAQWLAADSAARKVVAANSAG